MKRLFGYALMMSLAALMLGPAFADDEDEPKDAKEALQRLHQLIGTWNGVGGGGTPERPKTQPRFWKETIDWGWKFKTGDPHLVMSVKDGYQFKSGELRYLTDKKVYQLKLQDIKGKDMVFEGPYQRGYLILERDDPAEKETQQLKLNLAGDGIRMIYRYASKTTGRTLFTPQFYVSASKEGESLAAKSVPNKDRECVVSGGLGTMQVSFMGKTYWVCCSGCRDEFAADPAKYVKEFEAKKKAGK